ncbi:choice-of-anchor N protein [Methylomonas sp. MgM2]
MNARKIPIILALSAVMVSPAFALNPLQLGPGDAAGWSYIGGGDDTWYTNQASFTLNAYANATKADGGNGNYAWAVSPDSKQYAYLVASAVPDYGDIGDLFNLSISNDSIALTLLTSGYGTPPVEDDNDLAPHGIFDTYFEIYEFQFDGAIVDITDTQPGSTGTGKGYIESFVMSWTETAAATSEGGLDGVHFDLFTVSGGDGARYQPPVDQNKKLVYANAPYSHDAQSLPSGTPPPPPPSGVPEPNILALMGLGAMGFGLNSRRKKQI